MPKPEEAGSGVPEELAAAEAALAHEKYDALFEQNNDLSAGSRSMVRIDYPVMQTANKPDFYLKRSFDKSYSDYGVPYWTKPARWINNIVIYGHHMKNKTMFSDLSSTMRMPGLF